MKTRHELCLIYFIVKNIPYMVYQVNHTIPQVTIFTALQCTNNSSRRRQIITSFPIIKCRLKKKNIFHCIHRVLSFLKKNTYFT